MAGMHNTDTVCSAGPSTGPSTDPATGASTPPWSSPAVAWQDWIYCALAMVTVGSTVVASKLIAAALPPFLATALRHALALPLFGLLLWFTGRRLPGWSEVSRHDRMLLLLQAAAGSVGYGVLLLFGLRWSSAADAGIVVGTLPAVAGLFAMLALKERPGGPMVLALLLATVGVVTLTAGPADGAPGPGAAAIAAGAPRPLAGLLLLLGAVGCEALFILLNKRLQRPLPALEQSTLMSAGGSLLAGAAAVFELLGTGLPSAGAAAAVAWLGVLYYALVPTVGGFLLWYGGSARLSASQAALTTALAPGAALLLSAVVLGESIRAAQWLGLGCVLLSIVVGTLGPRRR